MSVRKFTIPYKFQFFRTWTLFTQMARPSRPELGRQDDEMKRLLATIYMYDDSSLMMHTVYRILFYTCQNIDRSKWVFYPMVLCDLFIVHAINPNFPFEIIKNVNQSSNWVNYSFPCRSDLSSVTGISGWVTGRYQRDGYTTIFNDLPVHRK